MPGSTRGVSPTAMAAGLGVAGAAATGDLNVVLSGISEELTQLASDVTFSDHHQSVADLETGISDLIAQVQDFRARGYQYKNFLERKCEVLLQKWQEAEPQIRARLDTASRDLIPQYEGLSSQYAQVSSMGRLGQTQVSSLNGSAQELRARVNATEASLQALYSGVRQTFYQTQVQVRQVAWLLDQVDQASFDLLAGENIIQAVEAKWWRDGRDSGPEGILYLTDQRILFEQKEKVATKKVLFVTTASEMVQELLLATPVSGIESVKASTAGLMGGQDHLDFDFNTGDFVNAHFHIKGQDSTEWAALVKRVLNGEIMRERYYAEGEEAQAEIQATETAMTEAPTNCTACGAPLDEQIVRGQRQIECEFCGTVMRW
nr:hypothetical protein [Anaerolineae bacterium]